MRNVLALSSSRAGGGAYLESALPLIQSVLGGGPRTVAFIPFAAVDRQYERYGAQVQQALAHLPYTVRVVQEGADPAVLNGVDAVLVGGGNTFKLLHDLYHHHLLNLLREKVAAGLPYIGWSAGANITGRSIGTTNDMPIIQPRSFAALGFLPFQLNPHYLNEQRPGFHGETRDQRLEEFVLLHPGVPVVGLPEGTALQLRNNTLRFLGAEAGVLFGGPGTNGPGRRAIPPGEDLSFLLAEPR